MRARAVLHFVNRWLGRCGEACCVGRSQLALKKTLEREKPRT
jgi:hypothetical protein